MPSKTQSVETYPTLVPEALAASTTRRVSPTNPSHPARRSAWMPWKSLRIARWATASRSSSAAATDDTSPVSTSRVAHGKPGPGSRRTRHTTSCPFAARTAATVPPTKPVPPVTAMRLGLTRSPRRAPAGPRAGTSRRPGPPSCRRVRRRSPQARAPLGEEAVERGPLPPVRLDVALEEEPLQRLARRRLAGADPGVVADVVVRHRHPTGPEGLDALVVAVDRLAAVVDRRDGAVGVGQHGDGGVDVAGLADAGSTRTAPRA